MRYRTEAELTTPVAQYLRRKGFRLQETELQFYDYSIDLYAFCHTSDLTLSVELKVTDWRRAIQQAHIYQLCSDLVMIALPQETVHRVDIEALADMGIGLLSVGISGRCRLMLEPQISPVISSTYRETHIELMKGTRSGKR